MESTYERALERARSEGVSVVGQSDASGVTRWEVENPGKHAWYTVTRYGDGPLTCTCEAGVRGLVCKHVAVVRESLRERRADRDPRRTAGAMYVERMAEEAAVWA